MRQIGVIPTAEETSPQYVEGRKILASGDRSVAAYNRILELGREDPIWAGRMLMEPFIVSATMEDKEAIARATA